MTERQDELNELLANPPMLTTLDNPYNPFIQFDEWQAYDVSQGHHTLSYIGRIVQTSQELSDVDELLALDTAIDEILSFNVNGLYLKVTEKTWKDRSDSVVHQSIEN